MKYIKFLILSSLVFASSPATAYFGSESWLDNYRKESEIRSNEQKRYYAELQRQDRIVLITLGVIYGILLTPLMVKYYNRLHGYIKWTFGSNDSFQKEFDRLIKELVWLDEQFSEALRNTLCNPQSIAFEYELTRTARLCGYKLGANKKPVHEVVWTINALFDDLDAYYQAAKNRNVTPSLPETDYLTLKAKLELIKTELIKSVEFSSENRELIIKSTGYITQV